MSTTSREEDPWVDGYFDATEGNPKKSKNMSYREGYKAGLDGLGGRIKAVKHPIFDADHDIFIWE